MKQRIIIPDRITAGIFNLPCVHSIRKSGGSFVCYIIDEGYAKPGDALVEDGKGRWHIEKKAGKTAACGERKN